MRSIQLFGVFALLAISCTRLSASAQSTPLTIVSPSSGTVVIPGQTINVEVVRAPNSGISSVALNYGDWTPIAEGIDPLTFPIVIPLAAQAGPLRITAVDTTLRGPGGSGSVSSPLILTVAGAPITSLGANLREIHFRSAGGKRRIHIIGYASPGVPVALQNPTAISFVSQASTIATVNQSGVVTALSPGQTTITAAYTAPDGSKVFVNVPVMVAEANAGDLNGDLKVDREDVAILQAALNTPAAGPLDARDLNHDGIIDAKDLAILRSLCTYGGCAVDRAEASELTFNPSGATFGNVAVGSSSNELTITATNRTASAATYSGESNVNMFKFQEGSCGPISSGTMLAAGGSCTFKIVFSPTVAGPMKGNFAISTVNGPVAFQMSGVGVAPITGKGATLVIVPSSGDFSVGRQAR